MSVAQTFVVLKAGCGGGGACKIVQRSADTEEKVRARCLLYANMCVCCRNMWFERVFGVLAQGMAMTERRKDNARCSRNSLFMHVQAGSQDASSAGTQPACFRQTPLTPANV